MLNRNKAVPLLGRGLKVTGSFGLFLWKADSLEAHFHGSVGSAYCVPGQQPASSVGPVSEPLWAIKSLGISAPADI